MNLENLTQYNADQFFRMLGNLIQQRRNELKLSIEGISEATGLTIKLLEQLESGSPSLQEEQLRRLLILLSVHETDLLKIAKITQVQNIMDVTRELNAKFPE